ncbi:MAG: pantoate--beta-alanine ligase [Deltaproteobacteria bacterium]|nr:pantoate--beta-alanine ligase [Deltaproteobacteria bacterium]
MPLEVIPDKREMAIRAEEFRRDGRRIAFVPTMGFLHAGHVSLLEEGRRRGDVLVLSIFVNPIQFGPNEDLARYPRDLPGDLEKARRAGVDVAFVPEPAQMYTEGFQTSVEVREIARGLCGDKRPGHFVGVATVVTKLFHIIKPHVALFGEKDYQQLAVIRRMVLDLDFDIEVLGMPIVREPDELAMSSRNAYLSGEERQKALVLSRTLNLAEEMVREGERDAARVLSAARALINSVGGVRIDYVDLRDAVTLAEVARIERPTLLAVAAFVGKTRLIDNRVLTPRS